MSQAVRSIYESFRSYNGIVALQPEHQARFENSLKVMGYEGKIPDLINHAHMALNQPEVRAGTHDVKVWNIQGENKLNESKFILLPRYNGAFLWEKWKVKPVRGSRDNPGVKSGNTEFQKSLRKKAIEEGYDEILMIDEAGWVREGGITNVFFEKEGVLYTPSEGMLPGICRQLILTAAERLEIPTEVRPIHIDELDESWTMFMTSSIRGIVPTTRITPMMKRLAGWCSSLIDQRISDPVETKLMGVINVTPDSFSDGGKFYWMSHVEIAKTLLNEVKDMIESGVDVIDVGGESTGPGSQDVSVDDELKRVVATVKKIRQYYPDVTLSVDTWKSEVARQAIEAGANMINDVTGGRGDERIFDVAAEFNVPLVLMYSKDDTPRTSTEAVEYEDVIQTIKDFLLERIEKARAAGVKEIIIDPGMGAFISTKPKYSFEIMDRIEELRELGCPILVGTSKKSCLGEDRVGGTLATTVMLKGRVDYLRVHDVLENATVV